MNDTTSWQKVSKWYDSIVGELGHYYHQNIVIPGALRLLDLKSGDRLLDLACGQGVLSRALPKGVYYHGVDQSKNLIQSAKNYPSTAHHHFSVADICQPLTLEEKELFSHASILLALQNIDTPIKVFENFSKMLKSSGKLLIVVNHPCFRIPRQSSWGIDTEQKTQYRRIQRYLTPQKVPIQMEPSKKDKASITWSFHYPLSLYSLWLQESGFAIERIEEWKSDKKSEGKYAAMENRARDEFPLFLAILATKK